MRNFRRLTRITESSIWKRNWLLKDFAEIRPKSLTGNSKVS